MSQAPTAPLDPTPRDFLRVAWRLFKLAPGMFFLRIGYDLFAVAIRLLAATVVVGVIGLHFVEHMSVGEELGRWPIEFAAELSDPWTALAFAGVIFTAWCILFAAEALSAAGVWGSLDALIRGKEVSKLGTPFAASMSRFTDAVVVRLFTSLGTLTLVTVLAGSIGLSIAVARAMGVWFESSVWVPAGAWAAIFTVVALSVALVRLTVEVVAAPVFLDDVSLGEAILRAADTVIRRPVFIYRLFVMAAAVLLPPLFLYYVAVMAQNVALQVGVGASAAATLRFGADVVLMAGFAGFMVAMHSMFFAYYAWEHGRLDEGLLAAAIGDSDTPPALKDLLPEEYPHIVEVDEILETWDEADLVPDDERPDPAPPVPPPPDGDDGEFDLEGMLRHDEEE